MKLFWSACTAALLAAFSHSALAVAVIAYEWTEGGPGNGVNSIYESRHGVGGPVLADDFIPTVGGVVTRIDWWGSAAASEGFEATFHDDAGGVPAATLPSGGIDQQFVTAPGSDPDGDAVQFFSAAWAASATPLALNAGTRYWFSVANFVAGWDWAEPGLGGPTVGSQAFAAVESRGVGPNGGPHFGPWNGLLRIDETSQDFAFRVWVDAQVPEPATLALFVVGLAALAGLGRRRMRSAL